MEMENTKKWIPWANFLLIALNAGVFAAGLLSEGMGRDAAMLYRRGALYAPLLLKGQDFYRLVTAVFLHADPAHLVNNMIVQFAGGEIAERNLGHVRYALLYLLSGIAGNAVSVLMDFLTGSYGFSVGASGAVFGVVGTLLFLILREARQQAEAGGRPKAGEERAPFSGHWEDPSEGRAQESGISPKMKSLLVRAGVMTVFLLYSGWSNPSVNQAAHVGGLVCGFLLAAVMMRGRDSSLETLL